MHILHVLLAAADYMLYAARQSEMLLVDKKELMNRLESRLCCQLCDTRIYPNSNRDYNRTDRTSYLNYCFNHFKCTSCSVIVHTKCFIGRRADKIFECPNPYCHTVLPKSEIDLFFGQLLLSYAYNKGSLDEFKALYSEYIETISKVHDTKSSPPSTKSSPLDSERTSCSSNAKLNIVQYYDGGITEFNYTTVMGIIINGKIALSLMDFELWRILSEYLVKGKIISVGDQVYIAKLAQGKEKRKDFLKRNLDGELVFKPTHKLYKLFSMADEMNNKNAPRDYVNVYSKYIENAQAKEMSHLCNMYFFRYIFQHPDALLNVEKLIWYILGHTEITDKKINIDKFQRRFLDVLIVANETVLKELFKNYNVSSNGELGLLMQILKYCARHEDFRIAKRLLCMALGVDGKCSSYAALFRDVSFKILFFCSRSPEIRFEACEICNTLKWCNANEKYFSAEQKEMSLCIFQYLLRIPIKSESIEIYQDTLANNYSSYLGGIYTKFIPSDSLHAICGGKLWQQFRDAECMNDFQRILAAHYHSSI